MILRFQTNAGAENAPRFFKNQSASSLVSSTLEYCQRLQQKFLPYDVRRERDASEAKQQHEQNQMEENKMKNVTKHTSGFFALLSSRVRYFSPVVHSSVEATRLAGCCCSFCLVLPLSLLLFFLQCVSKVRSRLLCDFLLRFGTLLVRSSVTPLRA